MACNSDVSMNPMPSTHGSTMSSSVSPGPVYSRLAADPVLGELVELFVQEMPGRIHAFEALARRRDWSE